MGWIGRPEPGAGAARLLHVGVAWGRERREGGGVTPGGVGGGWATAVWSPPGTLAGVGPSSPVTPTSTTAIPPPTPAVIPGGTPVATTVGRDAGTRVRTGGTVPHTGGPQI